MQTPVGQTGVCVRAKISGVTLISDSTVPFLLEKCITRFVMWVVEDAVPRVYRLMNCRLRFSAEEVSTITVQGAASLSGY
jgi:hypothetical protein